MTIHGIMKTFLATTLLMGKRWAYPVGSAFLTIFVASVSVRVQETILVRAGQFDEGAAPSARSP